MGLYFVSLFKAKQSGFSFLRKKKKLRKGVIVKIKCID